MKKAGFNMEKVKANNSASILRLINQKGPMSRKDIASELGLTSAAVTILCNDLISQKVITDIGEVVEENRAGRKKILIDINYQNKMILSISIQPTNTFIYLCDMKGNPLHNTVLKTNNQIEPAHFLSEIADEVKNLLIQIGLDWVSILGVGVTVTGIVDNDQGISMHAYGIWNKEVPVKAILEDLVPVQVVLGNNVKAFAEAELLYGSRRTNEHVLFVKWGPGVGSSIAIRNSTYEGKDFMAGELGHFIVDPEGKKCRCGRKGCLETKVSYQAIVENIASVFTLDKMPALYKSYHGDIHLFATDIIENNRLDHLLHSDEKEVDLIIMECIRILALSVVNAMTILAPNQVIVLSPIFDKESYFTYFMECCNHMNHGINVQINKSKLENAADYIGGVAISANQFFFNIGGIER